MPTTDPDIISKAEFARRRNVKPPRVTQWIEAKKIYGAALVGEGRYAQIRESIACEQLNRTLDTSQRFSNGLGTRLLPTSADETFSATAGRQHLLGLTGNDQLIKPPNAYDPALLSTQDMIAQQRLIQLSRVNERAQIDDAVARGRLVDGQIAKASVSREVALLVSKFEGSLTDFATAVAAEFKLPQRDVLHILRGKYREVRSVLAADSRDRASIMPATIEFDLNAVTPPASQPEEDDFSDEVSQHDHA